MVKQPEFMQLADETRRAMEPASIAETLSSRLFAEFDGTILITGFAGDEDLLNSHEASGVWSAIDSVSTLLRMLFLAQWTSQILLHEDDVPEPPLIKLKYRKSLHDENDNLIFDAPGFRLPTIWIHRGHGGYDENGEIGISVGLDSDPMVSTQIVSNAISSCTGALLLAILPVCTSAPSSKILRQNPQIVMAEGNDDTTISNTQSEDRMRSLDQLRGLMYLRGWYYQVLDHLDGIAKQRGNSDG